MAASTITDTTRIWPQRIFVADNTGPNRQNEHRY
jgi:hypothetical protein